MDETEIEARFQKLEAEVAALRERVFPKPKPKLELTDEDRARNASDWLARASGGVVNYR